MRTTTEGDPMFGKKRQIRLSVEKVDKDQNALEPSADGFDKTAFVLDQVGRLGKKVFVGVCIYVILDTYRQVRIAEANNPPDC